MKNLQKYKEKIEKMLANNINNKSNIIEKLIKIDLEHHKIEKEEYDELVVFLKEKIEEQKKEESTTNESMNKNDYKMNLKVEPIYKGQIGKVAPKRGNIKEDKEEER